jgi:DNA-binding IclR family transcriptional regulator
MTINQSLAHGLDILSLYDSSQPMFAVSEISQKLKFSQSKAYRLVRTLVQYGLLQEDNGTARYILGSNVLRLGLLAQQQFNIATIARPYMKELSQITKETVLLTAVNGTKGIVLDKVESGEPIRYSVFQPGATIPLHAGASSKILMAFLPGEECDRIIKTEGLKRYTPHTITSKGKLKEHLKEIRRKGYAISDQEVDRDVRAIAAPILNESGELVAGLSVAGPAYRMKKKMTPSIAKLTIQFTAQIAGNLWKMASLRRIDL